MKFFQKRKKRLAMTLIELLISLSIIAIMTLVAIPVFSVFQRNASLNSDAEAIAQLIEHARALNSNAGYQRFDPRTSASSNYVIKLSQVDGNNVFELFSEAEQTFIIDSVRLNSQIEIFSDSDIFSIQGDLNNEKLFNCGQIGLGQDNCPNPFEIIARVKGANSGKLIRVNHSDKPFLVEVINEIDQL